MDVRDNAPLIAAGGGVLLFIALFMSWFGPFSAWEAFDLTDIVLALIAILAIAVGVSTFTGNTLNVPGGAGATVTTAGIVAFSMVASWFFEGEERKFGLFLAVIGAIGIIVGGMQLVRSGGAPSPRARTASDAPTQTQPPPPPPPSSSTGAGPGQGA